MNDKELLELAAKSAGIEIEWQSPFVAISDFAQVPYNAETGDVFDPLTDDGDALRLAVKLEIDVQFYNVHSHHVCVNDYIYEQLDNDPYAATRRAIVRSAAEIGKGLP